jgi:hypothetical protein
MSAAPLSGISCPSAAVTRAGEHCHGALVRVAEVGALKRLSRRVSECL